jgi:cytochrome c5
MKYLLIAAGLIGLQVGFIAATGASERMDDGLKAYQENCATCHESGVDGAPQTSEPTDWDSRSPLWEAVQVVHAEKGYLNMPARGGDKDLSDYDVNVAAEYMLNISHPDFPQD